MDTAVIVIMYGYAGFWALMGLAWAYEQLYSAVARVVERRNQQPLPPRPERMRIPRRVDLRDEEKVESWLWQHLRTH